MRPQVVARPHSTSHRPTLRVRAAVAFGAMSLAACTDTGQVDRPWLSTRDSAGVQIAEIHGDPTMRLAGARTGSDTARVKAGIAEADRMDRLPVLSLIRTDSRGRVWMRTFVWRPGDRVARWLVFEPSGKVLGTVATPANLQVFDIGEDYILGTDRDKDDAERVVMYPYAAVR